MKLTKKLKLSLIASLFCLAQASVAQVSSVNSGGEATGNGAHLSYSIGQTFYISNSGSTGSMNQGVQQVYSSPPVSPPPANNNCGSAEELSLATFPNIINVQGTLFSATNSGGAGCAGSANGGDVYYSFTLPEENHVGVTVNPFAGADVVVQVLDACGGTSIACIDNAGAGSSESELLENLAAGSYIVRVHNSGGLPEPESSASFLINVQQMPYAQVQNNPSSSLFGCNTIDRDLGDFIGASPQSSELISGGSFPILDYQWLIGQQGGGTVNEWQRTEPNYSTRLEWLGMSYGATYNVFVRLLINHPVFGPTWGVYQGDYNNPNLFGASSCTVSTSASPSTTEVLPAYTPTNVNGIDYALCDFAIAYNVLGADNFRWRFDGNGVPGDAEDILYTRGSGNPAVRLSWVNGLQPGATYQVAVEAQVDGIWGGYGNVNPITLAGVPNNLTLSAGSCNGTYAPNGVIVAQNLCFYDFYQFRLTPQAGGDVRLKVSFSHVLLMGTIQPALAPGVYDVDVRIRQNGVLGDFGPSCPITISGPTMPGDAPVAERSETFSNATLFPNPNAGSEVRMELDGLSDGNHEVMIQIYDVYGKLIQTDGFGHQGNRLSRLVRFENELAMGMYMVQIVVDGDRFATERLIISNNK